MAKAGGKPAGTHKMPNGMMMGGMPPKTMPKTMPKGMPPKGMGMMDMPKGKGKKGY